jgi:hypothetical protein
LKKKIPASVLAGAVKSGTQYQKFSVSTIKLAEVENTDLFRGVPGPKYSATRRQTAIFQFLIENNQMVINVWFW